MPALRALAALLAGAIAGTRGSMGRRARLDSMRAKQTERELAAPAGRAPVALLGAGALLGAVAALSVAAAGDGVLPGDVAVARVIQGAAMPDGRRLVAAVNWLGQAFPGTAALTLVAVSLLVRARRPAAALLVAATLPVRLVNPGLKALFDSPRPTEEVVRVTERAAGLGYPSGHALGAVLFYGALIAVAPCLVQSPRARRLLRLTCLLLILATGLSRVASGAHWPTDVLGGYLWGGVLLAALLAVERIARGRRAEPPCGGSGRG